jgi:dTDP-4-dehydrorhamnose reductase
MHAIFSALRGTLRCARLAGVRVLILGASGLVGGVLWTELSHRHDVVGTCHGTAVPELVPLDLQDEKALARLSRDGFDVVVHCAGLVEISVAEAHPDLAWALNVRSVEVLLNALEGGGSKLVVLSSDNVFDGTRDSYTEDDPPSPINTYGRTKVAAESRIVAGGRHLAVRIPIVYGRSPWADRFFARFARPETPAQVDVVGTPLYLPSLARTLEQLWDLAGVVHFAGSEVLTRFELMSRLASGLGLPTAVVPVRNDETPGGSLRPRRLVLRSSRHPLAGPSLDDALADMVGTSS